MNFLPRQSSLDDDRLLEILLAGESFHGERIDLSRLVRHAAHKAIAFDELKVIDAVIGGQIAMSCPCLLTRCKAFEPVRITDCTEIRFRHCQFGTTVLVEATLATELYVDSCEFHGLVELDWHGLPTTEPTFRKTSFNANLKICVHADGPFLVREQSLHFDECTYSSDVLIQIIGTSPVFEFRNCVVHPGASLRIDESKGICSRLALDGSLIAGTVALEAPSRSLCRGPFLIDLNGVTCSGKLDFQMTKELSIEARRGAAFSPATVVIAPETRFWLREETEARNNFSRGGRRGPIDLAGRYESLSRQYLALIGAFENITITNDPDSDCAYRSGKYRVKADMCQQGLALCVTGCAFVFFWGSVILLLASGLLPLCYAAIVVGLPVVAVVGATFFPDSSLGRSVHLQWKLFAIWGVLGFGVRTMHPMFSGALLIIAFTAIYYVGTNHFSDSGYISVNENGKVETVELSDASYFSVVTFTTLGYGDFKPYGVMRSVAALEAGTGALVLAMLTAVFVRRFLKL